MQPCTILAILTVSILITLASGKIEGLPNDQNGGINCQPDDTICEHMKRMMESPQSFYFRRNLMDLSAFKRHGHGKEGLKCDSDWAKKLCASMQKTCYTDGTCGELLNEEKVVFDE